MNRPVFGALGVLAVLTLTVGSCKSDPFSDLDGGPAAVVSNFSYLQMAIGSSIQVTASVVDGRSTPMPLPVTFTPCTAAVTVVVDTSYHPVPVVSARAIVTAVTANPSCVRVAGGGLEDTITVAVLPVAFNGTASTATPMVGQLFSLYGSSQLGFNVTSANVDLGGGVLGQVEHVVADTLTVRVLQPENTPTAPLSVQGVAVKYVSGLTVTLPTATNFTVTNPFGVHDSPGQASAAITIPGDGAADLVFWDGFKTGDVDFFYPFTIASTDTLTFTLAWDTDADLDLANCNAACSAFIGGFGAAGSNNPETYSVIFPAGNYNLLVEQFDAGAGARLFKVTIHNP